MFTLDNMHYWGPLLWQPKCLSLINGSFYQVVWITSSNYGVIIFTDCPGRVPPFICLIISQKRSVNTWRMNIRGNFCTCPAGQPSRKVDLSTRILDLSRAAGQHICQALQVYGYIAFPYIMHCMHLSHFFDASSKHICPIYSLVHDPVAVGTI